MCSKAQTAHIGKRCFLLIREKIHKHLHIFLILQGISGKMAHLKDRNARNPVIGKLYFPFFRSLRPVLDNQRYFCFASAARQGFLEPVAASQGCKPREQRPYSVPKFFRQLIACQSFAFFQRGRTPACQNQLLEAADISCGGLYLKQFFRFMKKGFCNFRLRHHPDFFSLQLHTQNVKHR